MKQKIFGLFLVCAVMLSACAAPAATPAVQTVVVETVPAPTTAPVEISWVVFETPALTASFWDGVIQEASKTLAYPALQSKS